MGEDKAGNWRDATASCTNEHNKRASVIQAGAGDAGGRRRPGEGRAAKGERHPCRGIHVSLPAALAFPVAAVHMPPSAESHVPRGVITCSDVRKQLHLSAVSGRGGWGRTRRRRRWAAGVGDKSSYEAQPRHDILTPASWPASRLLACLAASFVICNVVVLMEYTST